MTRPTGRLPGALLAIGLAGPVFMLIATAADPLLSDPPMPGNTILLMLSSLLLAPLSIPFGAAIAVVPVTVGTLVLSRLGSRVVPLRHPLAWAIVGALGGAAMSLGQDDWQFRQVAAALVLTGLVCASIARIWVRWEPAQPSK